MPDPTPERVCERNYIDWSWPRLPLMIAWRCDAWPDLGECTNDRRPCTSPTRNHCRAGLTRHGYFTRMAWRYQQSDAGLSGYAHTDWDSCHNPFSGVRASDWLKELDEP